MKRIIVIGTTGSGKSTMANHLAEILDLPVIGLDELIWKPNWELRDRDEYLVMLKEKIESDTWVIDGNTRRNRPLVWGEADTVVWLNYSFPLIFCRLFIRTVRRVFTQEEVMPGCVETFRSQFLSNDSLFVWLFKDYRRRKKDYRHALQREEFQHLQVLEFNRPRQANKFLAQLREQVHKENL